MMVIDGIDPQKPSCRLPRKASLFGVLTLKSSYEKFFVARLQKRPFALQPPQGVRWKPTRPLSQQRSRSG